MRALLWILVAANLVGCLGYFPTLNRWKVRMAQSQPIRQAKDWKEGKSSRSPEPRLFTSPEGSDSPAPSPSSPVSEAEMDASRVACPRWAEGRTRSVLETKIQFHTVHARPIPSPYKEFVHELLATISVQTSDPRYKYDALYAFGLCTQFYTIMKDYPPKEVDRLFDDMMAALGLDACRIRRDAKQLLSELQNSPLPHAERLEKGSAALTRVIEQVQSNCLFKYSDAWGIGLGRLLELSHIPPSRESFQHWSHKLRWVPATRLMQTWSQFTLDQLRMQHQTQQPPLAKSNEAWREYIRRATLISAMQVMP